MFSPSRRLEHTKKGRKKREESGEQGLAIDSMLGRRGGKKICKRRRSLAHPFKEKRCCRQPRPGNSGRGGRGAKGHSEKFLNGQVPTSDRSARHLLRWRGEEFLKQTETSQF